MNNFHQNTCIRFVPLTMEKLYVYISKFVNDIECQCCATSIGFTEQVMIVMIVILDKPCYQLGTVVHKLRHAISLGHKLQRSDRDDHITVNNENILTNFTDQFDKMKALENKLASKYNHTSIMHYSGGVFFKSAKTKAIIFNGSSKLLPVKRKYGLSEMEIRALNDLQLHYKNVKKPS